jgi:hypothetical protein
MARIVRACSKVRSKQENRLLPVVFASILLNDDLRHAWLADT